MLEPDLQLAPPPDSHRLIPMLVIAAIVMTAVGVAVYMLNPRKTAEITVQKTELFAPHTEFKQTPSSSNIIGAAEVFEDDVYVVATLRIRDKLRLPIFLTNTSATLTKDDGTTLEATVISPLDLPRLEETFPQILPLVSAPAPPPLQFEDAIEAGTSRAGTVVLLFPLTSEKQWHAKKSATLTVHLAHDAAPIEVALP
ncbi:MAG: hypothetical protein ABR971_09670 [Acidobacteriaceae bacterium]|jgi:hypothetical protein